MYPPSIVVVLRIPFRAIPAGSLTRPWSTSHHAFVSMSGYHRRAPSTTCAIFMSVDGIFASTRSLLAACPGLRHAFDVCHHGERPIGILRKQATSIYGFTTLHFVFSSPTTTLAIPGIPNMVAMNIDVREHPRAPLDHGIRALMARRAQAKPQHASQPTLQ
jgi:hypothetical protein